ncbi:MAG: PIN domain-containing protein [Pseudomonadota bacterium]
MGHKIVLDACVFFPPLVRGIVLGAAETGLFRPVWSKRILDEWRIAALRKQGSEAEDAILGVQARMAETFPDAMVVFDPEAEASLRLPDPGDVHVLATAIEAEAKEILTFNLRDFPRRALQPHGVEALHPDGFLWLLFSEAPDRLAPAVVRSLAAHDIASGRQRAALKRARLPRFGKAWEAARAPGS